jgi:hypothetical protein
MAAIDADAPPDRAPILADGVRRALRRAVRHAMTALAILAAIAAGQYSSHYLVEHGSFLTTDRYGPWEHWREAGRTGADPYTRAHAKTQGTIRLSADSAGVFEARTDNDGARLHSSCDYVVEGPSTEGLWWSVAAFDSSGALIPNDANRHAFTRDTIAPNPDGSYIISLGRDARPGNWLPTSGAGRFVLVFTLLDPATGLSQRARDERYLYLPSIRSEGCS